MKIEQLKVLLPCYTLEDLELRRGADEADELLTAWTALWHPLLIQRAGCIPGWLSAEQPPQDPAGHLITLPGCCEPLVPEGWVEGAENAGSLVVRTRPGRTATVARLLEVLELSDEGIDTQLVADFFALGYCHLTIELLTRQLRYMSNLDESSFQQKLLAAANEGLGAGYHAAREHIQGAFDLLFEAREYFYPVESYLIDLTLVAESTLGEPLRGELAAGRVANLLLEGRTLELLAAREPDTLEALRAAIERGTVALVGGEQTEGPLPLLPPEAILWRIARGLETFRRHLDVRPVVFARRRFGLTPALPPILRRLGFQGALHQALDEGRYPSGNQSRLRWEGLDGTTLDAIGRVALDISRADAFLRLPELLGNAMDLDQVATVVLAHWAGHACAWYDDLRRAVAYTGALGNFVTLPRYFEQTGLSGQRVRYQIDQYRTPYLRQAVRQGATDPISRWARYYRRRALIRQIEALELLCACCMPTGAKAAQRPSGRHTSQGPGALDTSQTAHKAADQLSPAASLAGYGSHSEPLGSLVEAVEDAVDRTRPDEKQEAALDARLADQLAAAAGRFADALAAASSGCPEDAAGTLVINPGGFERRAYVELDPQQSAPSPGGVLRMVEQDGESRRALLDVPPMGFAWIGPGLEQHQPTSTRPAPARRRRWLPLPGRSRAAEEPPMAEEHVLRNEFMEITFDPATGAIRAISDYRTRGPRLAQQLALRMPVPGAEDPADATHYSIMAADRFEIISAGPIVGELLCTGRLMDRQGQRVAGFRQRTRVVRGSRVAELQIELDVDRPPGTNPWDSYYCCRFAWSDATASVYRAVNLADRPTDAVQLEAPLAIDIRTSKTRTTLLCAGLPYHRRFGLRKLDTLLVVAGDSGRQFRVGVGIDLPGVVAAGWQFLTPPVVVRSARPPAAAAGWLFHVDSRNVLPGAWQPLLAQGQLKGLRVQLLETEGRQAQVRLRLFRNPRWARRVDPPDAPARPLEVEGDCVHVPLHPHGWADVEVGFLGQPPQAQSPVEPEPGNQQPHGDQRPTSPQPEMPSGDPP